MEPIGYVTNIKVDVKAMTLPSDHEVDVNSQNYEWSDKFLIDNLNCSLPFDTENYNPICKTYDEGLTVVKSRLAKVEKYQKLPLQLEIDYRIEPKKFLLSSVRPQYAEAFIKCSKDEVGYVFAMPKDAKMISNKHEYSLIVALGYFGSITGIFMGVSVIHVLSWLTNYIKLKADVKKMSVIAIQIGMSIYLAIIFILLVNKFLKYPRDTSVNFAKTTSEFSMTICSTLQIYGVIGLNEEAHVSNDLFLMANKSYLHKWTDPRNILKKLVLGTGSREINLLENLPINVSLLPIDNQTVAACNTFELTAFKELTTLMIVYDDDIQVYIHNSGQFFYEWKTRQNLILPATEENTFEVNNMVYIFDIAATVNMERQIKLDAQDYQSYDQCVFDYGIEVFGADLMQCFFGKTYDNCNYTINNNSVILLQNFLDSQKKCKPPQDLLIVSTDKTVLLKRNHIKKEKITSEKIHQAGSLGFKKKIPTIELFFPKFTKFSKVIFCFKYYES